MTRATGIYGAPMNGPTTPAWALRLTDLLGARPDQVGEQHLQRLVDGSVREDADLDFKQERYGNTDSDKRDLAGDIAAMANHRGGLLIIGIRDENDVAVERTAVELVDGEEARIRQIAAGNIAPHLTFDVRVLESEDDASTGYYVLIVPPSGLRPHAVRQDRNLRYPRRDGTTTRWLSEPEVADAYRDRFTVATDQAADIAQVLDDGRRAIERTGDAALVVAVVPTGRGSMSIDLARVATVEQWAKDLGATNYFDGFFPSGVPPVAGVGAHRVTLTGIHERGRTPSWQYAELFEDGKGFAFKRLMDPRTGPMGQELPGSWILNESLLWELGRCLHLLGRHAAENCGAWGDALVEARLIGSAMHLAYLHRMAGFEHAEEIAGGRELNGAASRHTFVVEAVATVGPDLSATTRLVATDLFHAFGSPEVRQITNDGALRSRYLGGNAELRAWAEQRGIELTDETVAGE
jgi:hypothetical protein